MNAARVAWSADEIGTMLSIMFELEVEKQLDVQGQTRKSTFMEVVRLLGHRGIHKT